MRIGLIAPAWVPVPPPVYGGTELVVDHLARGFDAAGHDVTLFTTGDARCPVEKRWVHEHALGTMGDILAEFGHVQAAYEAFAGCDVIHDHTLVGPLLAMATATGPVVTTSHGPFTRELTDLYRLVGQHAAVVAISHHQASTAPTVPIAAVIHHGIDVERFPIGAGDGGYVLFLGRMNPDKGAHRAVEIARAAGKRILLAAKMWEPAEHRYYQEQVEPLLGDDAVYVGEVGGQDKLDLLMGAEALLNPIRWPEPFGLVMIEALATGTPVVAFREGSAPELVEHGVTGFIGDDDAELSTYLGELNRLDRAACRRDAEDRFSTQRMVDDHLALYQRLIDRRSSVPTITGRPSPSAPVALPG